MTCESDIQFMSHFRNDLEKKGTINDIRRNLVSLSS